MYYLKKVTILILFPLIFIACSEDDDKINIDNKVSIGDVEYSLGLITIRDENQGNPEFINNPLELEFNLSDYTFQQLDNEEDAENLLVIYFDIIAFEIQEGEYSSLNDYEIETGVNLTNGVISGGEVIASNRLGSTDNQKLSNTQFTISDLTSTSLTLEFTFRRVDGLTIQGFYSGSYRLSE